jgi:hypothetical protein
MVESEVRSLKQLIDRIRDIDKEHDPVRLEVILQAIGRRSFGPIILLTGLITLAPLIGDIPGVPTLMGLLVLLTAGQLLLGRNTFWLPGFLLKRSVDHARLHRVLDWLETPVRFIDRFLHPRLEGITHGNGALVIAVACVCIALTMPMLEFIPFSANLAGAALTAFGLALIARDGYLAVFALIVTAGTFWAVIANIDKIWGG